MRPHHASFPEIQKAIAAKLRGGRCLTVATTGRNGARARTVDYVSDGLEIAFFTWEGTTKLDDIRVDPRVALCLDDVCLEGRARQHALTDATVIPDLERFRRRLPDLHAKFTTLPGVVLVRVQASTARRLVVAEGGLWIDEIHVARRTARRWKLSSW